MSKGEESTSIVNAFLFLLLKFWDNWDVSVMVLLSLLLQIILSVLGNRRKYTNNLFIRIVLWFAHLSADWVAIATLSKLHGSQSRPTDYYYYHYIYTKDLRSFWAPLLILHLGGPDTITIYAYEENKLWTKHLLILVVKVVLVIYIIIRSWTISWLSFFSLPLIVAGIAKYVERILCLKLINSQKTKPIFSFLNFSHLLHNSSGIQPTFEQFLRENANVVAAYIEFSIMRPDVNNYQSYILSSAKIKIETCMEEILGPERKKANEFVGDPKPMDLLVAYISENKKDSFLKLTAELGLIFDFVYTKSAFIYTKTGCFLRLTSFACTFLAVLLFLINIMNQMKPDSSSVDTYITGILLVGAIALELFAAWVMFSSDWAILVAVFRSNVLVGKMFGFILKCFPCFLNQRKRRSKHMGQFDLLKYCWQYKKKANKSRVCLQKNIFCSDLLEIWRKKKCADFVKEPSHLKTIIDDAYDLDSLNPFKVSCGKRALQARQQYDHLKWSIKSGFDYSIIVWHLATSVCYYHDDSQDPKDAKNISKCVSDYMMYLLVMCPGMLLPKDRKSLWLGHTYDKLKELFSPATDTKAASALLLELDDNDCEENPESSNLALENLLKDVGKLATSLNKVEDKWGMIKEFWLEMLLFAAFSSGNISHVKQLGEGGEFLSLLWLLGGTLIMSKVHCSL